MSKQRGDELDADLGPLFVYGCGRGGGVGLLAGPAAEVLDDGDQHRDAQQQVDGPGPCLVDTRQPGTPPGKKGNLPPCRSRPDSEEFRRDAVALYENGRCSKTPLSDRGVGMARRCLSVGFGSTFLA